MRHAVVLFGIFIGIFGFLGVRGLYLYTFNSDYQRAKQEIEDCRISRCPQLYFGFDHLPFMGRLPQGVVELDALESVEVISIPIANAELLAEVDSLRRLYLYDTGIEDWRFLAGLTQLEELGVGFSKRLRAEDLEPLASLKVLILRHTSLEEFSRLASLPSLRKLIVGVENADALTNAAAAGLEVNGIEAIIEE